MVGMGDKGTVKRGGGSGGAEDAIGFHCHIHLLSHVKLEL